MLKWYTSGQHIGYPGERQRAIRRLKGVRYGLARDLLRRFRPQPAFLPAPTAETRRLAARLLGAP